MIITNLTIAFGGNTGFSKKPCIFGLASGLACLIG